MMDLKMKMTTSTKQKQWHDGDVKDDNHRHNENSDDEKSLMAKWFEQVSQWHGMHCHDLEVMSSNLGRVELGVRSTSVLSYTWAKMNYKFTLFRYLEKYVGAGEYLNASPEQLLNL